MHLGADAALTKRVAYSSMAAAMDRSFGRPCTWTMMRPWTVQEALCMGPSRTTSGGRAEDEPWGGDFLGAVALQTGSNHLVGTRVLAALREVCERHFD